MIDPVTPLGSAPPTRLRIGRRGEEIAAGYLERLGMRVLARNWHCREGELDIVARSQATLVAVEVKTRTSTRFGAPAEAVTVDKLTRIRRLARRWMATRPEVFTRVRVDVVSVLLYSEERCYLRHHQGVS